MGKWEIKKLGKIAEKITKGTTPTTNGYKYQKKGIGFVKVENLNKNEIDTKSIEFFISDEAHKAQSRSILKVDDLLFSIAGTIGKIALVKNEDLPLNTNQALAIIRGYKDYITPDFLRFTLTSKVLEETKRKARGGALQNISLTDLKETEIPLPPIPEQQRIVAKLDGLFEKIDKAISLLEENIAHTQALMESVLDEEFGRLEQSDLEPFLNAVLIQNKTLVPDDKETYNYVGLENIESNTGKLLDFSETLGETLKSSKVYFDKEDVLYGKLRPYLNKVWVSCFDGVATTEIIPFKTKQKKLIPRYLAYYLRSHTFLNVVNANTSGARMPRASARFFKDIATVPKVDIQHQERMIIKFDKLFNHLENIVETQTQKIDHLKALKSSLLDQAFKGEL